MFLPYGLLDTLAIWFFIFFGVLSLIVWANAAEQERRRRRDRLQKRSRERRDVSLNADNPLRVLPRRDVRTRR